MRKTCVKQRINVLLLDAAGQALGLFILYPGAHGIKQRITNAIRNDLNNFEAIISFLDKSLIYRGGEMQFEVSIQDDKTDTDPTKYVYYLKEIQHF